MHYANPKFSQIKTAKAINKGFAKIQKITFQSLLRGKKFHIIYKKTKTLYIYVTQKPH